MSSYYPSFNYKGVNSSKDKNLIVVAFDADQGEMDTFLGMEPIYTDRSDGSRRIDYGAKYNSVAVVKISVMKANRSEFSVAEVRDFLRWTTGSQHNSYLDLLVEDEIKASFLGRVTNVYQQKFDARTIGLIIEFTSVSPWAYSQVQTFTCSFGQSLDVDDGVVFVNGGFIGVEDDGVIYHQINANDDVGVAFPMNNKGVIGIDNTIDIYIDNKTDDLYSYINLDVVFVNTDCTDIEIHNKTIDEITTITNISKNETITINSGQFIISDKTGKIFGDTFNYIWPRLAPGVNDFQIVGTGGVGVVTFTYRYPIKIGDCAIDIGTFNRECACADSTDYGFIKWKDIIETPDTLEEYGIKNAYTSYEIDQKLSNCEQNISEEELNKMFADVFK